MPTAGPPGTPDTNILRFGFNPKNVKNNGSIEKHLKSKSRSYQSNVQKQEQTKSKKIQKRKHTTNALISMHKGWRRPSIDLEWNKLYRLFSCFLSGLSWGPKIGLLFRLKLVGFGVRGPERPGKMRGVALGFLDSFFWFSFFGSFFLVPFFPKQLGW